jgi:hypothetical protein
VNRQVGLATAAAAALVVFAAFALRTALAPEAAVSVAALEETRALARAPAVGSSEVQRESVRINAVAGAPGSLPARAGESEASAARDAAGTGAGAAASAVLPAAAPGAERTFSAAPQSAEAAGAVARDAAPGSPAAEADSEPAAGTSAQTLPRAASGVLRFHIVPWGEVHLDGRKVGAAPPLGRLSLPPGTHRIEVRNPGFASHAQVVEVRAGEELSIRYRFE